GEPVLLDERDGHQPRGDRVGRADFPEVRVVHDEAGDDEQPGGAARSGPADHGVRRLHRAQARRPQLGDRAAHRHPRLTGGAPGGRGPAPPRPLPGTGRRSAGTARGPRGSGPASPGGSRGSSGRPDGPASSPAPPGSGGPRARRRRPRPPTAPRPAPSTPRGWAPSGSPAPAPPPRPGWRGGPRRPPRAPPPGGR